MILAPPFGSFLYSGKTKKSRRTRKHSQVELDPETLRASLERIKDDRTVHRQRAKERLIENTIHPTVITEKGMIAASHIGAFSVATIVPSQYSSKKTQKLWAQNLALSIEKSEMHRGKDFVALNIFMYDEERGKNLEPHFLKLGTILSEEAKGIGVPLDEPSTVNFTKLGLIGYEGHQNLGAWVAEAIGPLAVHNSANETESFEPDPIIVLTDKATYKGVVQANVALNQRLRGLALEASDPSHLMLLRDVSVDANPQFSCL